MVHFGKRVKALLDLFLRGVLLHSQDIIVIQEIRKEKVGLPKIKKGACQIPSPCKS
jgi:exonuclease III